MALDGLLQRFSDTVAEAAGQVRASVVQVRAGQNGIGSGVIWHVGAADVAGEAEATVITNAHVVRAARQSDFRLRLADGREIVATATAIDPEHDLAALQTRASGLHAAMIGDSTALRVGEVVIAVGNPFGREGAVTTGVVAARAPADADVELDPATAPEPWRGGWRPRQIELIQADISLYPGNSGGPLADARGRVVGINAMVGGGLAFAIPSHTVRHFLEEVEMVAEPLHLGVQVLTVPVSPALRQRLNIAQEFAPLVSVVEAGSVADTAGVIVGDLLLALDERSLVDARQLPRLLHRFGASDQQHTLSVLRGGERRDIQFTLQPRAQAAA